MNSNGNESKDIPRLGERIGSLNSGGELKRRSYKGCVIESDVEVCDVGEVVDCTGCNEGIVSINWPKMSSDQSDA